MRNTGRARDLWGAPGPLRDAATDAAGQRRVNDRAQRWRVSCASASSLSRPESWAAPAPTLRPNSGHVGHERPDDDIQRPLLDSRLARGPQGLDW